MTGVLNILFLGGARRVSMARLFKEAGKRLGYDEVRIFSYEISRHVPILTEGEVIIGRRWNAEDLYDHLHSVVVENEITIIIPFVDGAVSVAQEYEARYPGEVYVPAKGNSTAMFDKCAADDVFRAASLAVPEKFSVDTITESAFPVIAKPRFGSASKGILVFHNLKEWEARTPSVNDYLIQKFIASAEEYTVDCFVTLNGTKYLSSRRRLEVTGGEVTRTITVDDSSVAHLACDTLRATGLKGAVTVQILRDPLTGEFMIMEVNPRLGGGAVCSVKAGFHLPEAIISEASGLPVKPMSATPGVEMIRYYQELMIYPE